ncbi:MAG: N-acetyltransferase [Planctomycetes bacterium]|nr:N-acetyltransferase [Planctomycetota bacterium]
MTYEIREETPSDPSAIHFVTAAAFRNMPYADGDEQEVVDRLRSAGALALSLVATVDQKVIGQISFSPAVSSSPSDAWFALGPVSVLPELQHMGIGSALIERGLARIREQGAVGCILTGSPTYYRRFGFEPAPRNAPDNEPKDFFMVKTFGSKRPVGQFRFHDAFYGDAHGS